MNRFIVVAIGAGIGGAFRHGVNLAALRLLGPGFPHGTFTVNIAGSLVMGLLAGWFAHKADPGQAWRLFLTTGVLGGFTTFSAFSLDAAVLLQRDQLVAHASAGHHVQPLGHKLAVAQSLLWPTLREGRTVVCNDTLAEGWDMASLPHRRGVRSVLAVPLRTAQGVVGSLKVTSDQPQAFSRREVAHLEILTESLGAMVQLRHVAGRERLRPLLLAPEGALLQRRPDRARTGDRLRRADGRPAPRVGVLARGEPRLRARGRSRAMSVAPGVRGVR